MESLAHHKMNILFQILYFISKTNYIAFHIDLSFAGFQYLQVHTVKFATQGYQLVMSHEL